MVVVVACIALPSWRTVVRSRTLVPRGSHGCLGKMRSGRRQALGILGWGGAKRIGGVWWGSKGGVDGALAKRAKVLLQVFAVALLMGVEDHRIPLLWYAWRGGKDWKGGSCGMRMVPWRGGERATPLGHRGRRCPGIPLHEWYGGGEASGGGGGYEWGGGGEGGVVVPGSFRGKGKGRR